MSGPKIDSIEIERRRKAELERLRQERLRKIREETEKLNKAISETNKQNEKIEQHLTKELQKVKDVEGASIVTKDLYSLKEKCTLHFENALSFDIPTEPDAIHKRALELINITNTITKHYFDESKSLEEDLRDYIKRLEISEEFASIKFSSESEKLMEIVDFDFSIRLDSINNADDISIDIKEKSSVILSDIEKLVNSESIQTSDLRILSVIANSIYRSAFGAETGFRASEIEFNTVKPGIVKNIEIFDELYQEYYAEYVVFLESLNKNKTSRNVILPKEKHKFASIEQLRHEKEMLSLQSKIVNEKNYIREQIDDVMKEFGYNLSKEIIFGKHGKGNHYLCNDASRSSAIHIHLSDENQIMMEIVAIEANTEIQNGNIGMQHTASELNANENNYLLSHMGIFCDLHPKFVERMNERGLIFNMKSRKEIEEKYSRNFTAGDGKPVGHSPQANF